MWTALTVGAKAPTFQAPRAADLRVRTDAALGAPPWKRYKRGMLETFQPLIDAAKGLDLDDTAAAEAELQRRLDPSSPAAQAMAQEFVRLYREGQVANRGEEPVFWSRVAKASDASSDFSIDVVVMNGAGPRHRHPAGEVDFCIAMDGEPTFDGRPPGWVVFGSDSVHVPTVAGGTMLIVYLLPGGAMEFLG